MYLIPNHLSVYIWSLSLVPPCNVHISVCHINMPSSQAKRQDKSRTSWEMDGKLHKIAFTFREEPRNPTWVTCMVCYVLFPWAAQTWLFFDNLLILASYNHLIIKHVWRSICGARGAVYNSTLSRCSYMFIACLLGVPVSAPPVWFL